MEFNATNTNFDELINTELPVLIDFWATWCGPCRALAPTVEEIAKEYEGKVKVIKCNVDDCAEIAGKFSIRNIPTLIYMKNSEVLNRTVGNISKEEIVNNLSKLF